MVRRRGHDRDVGDAPGRTAECNLNVPSPQDRARWLDLVGDRRAHERIASDLACLREVDVVEAPEPIEIDRWLRVAVWNIERGRDPARIGSLLRATGAHVALLSEVDVGMGRTGNVDVGRAVANTFGSGLAFGVEFVELGLGKTADPSGAGHNEHGLHGNAICGRVPLRDPSVVRFDEGGGWFTHDRGEPRVGGRMAVVGTVVVDGVDVTVVSVHLESHSDPELRAAQMDVLFEAIGPGPALIGGDLNTFGASLGELADRDAVRQMRAAEPTRFSWPADHEPLFVSARERGFEWVDANVAAPTTRHGPDALPDHQPLKLDWILVRDLEARRPVVIAATGPDGAALSDHELLAVSVRPLA